MRIATWNIGGAFIYSKDKHEFDLEQIDYFAAELKAIKPDIVCLQETHTSQNNNQAKIIANALNFKYEKTEIIADSHLKDGEKLAISIISKYPIISAEFKKLTNPNLEFIWRGKKAFSHDKGFVEAKINYNNTTIKILSGHMAPFHKFKRDFLDDDFKIIRKEIENIITDEKLATIACVDMNFENIHKLIPKIFDKNFNFILEDKATFFTGEKYDKIIISEDWESSNSDIIKGKADHYLCLADIELK